MDRGMIAFWYDLPEKDRDEYLSWLHEVHLPEILAGREELLWAAHYERAGGDDRFHEVVKDMMRAKEGEVGAGRDYLLLIGAASPHTFFNPNFPQIRERHSGETKEMVGRRIVTMPAPSLGFSLLTRWYPNPLRQPIIVSSASSWRDK